MKILRKAQIEVSFNWIFVLIAGGAILIFFIMIANNQLKGSKVESSTIISERLQSLLAAIQQNPEGVQIQDNLNVEISFDCEVVDGIYSHVYTVGESTKKANLESEMIFSPRKLGNSKTIAWTQVYGSPYPVVQALYFSDEKTQYIFESNTRDYYFKFPEQFERKLLSSSEIEQMEDEKFRKYVIVTRAGTSLAMQDSSVEKKSTIVRVGENSVEFIYGGNYGDSVSVPYVDEATLFGAIISGDDKLYGCTMDKLMQLSRIVGEINLNRTEMLSQTDNEKCKQFFEPAHIPEGYIREIIDASVYPPTGDYTSLRDSMTSLFNINRDMARSNCPTIY